MRTSHRFSLATLVACLFTVLPAAADVPSAGIDPDQGAYGVPFGATEKQLIEKLGPASGSLQLSPTRRALFYGRSHVFLFRKGAFRGVLLSQFGTLDHRLTDYMDMHPRFDAASWKISPGITGGMNYAQVARLLKKPEGRGDYRLNYETSSARVELTFSGMGERNVPESFSLIGAVIESDR